MSFPGRRGQRPIISAGTAEEAIALCGTSWVAGAAPKPHARSSDGDTTIEFFSEVVTSSVFVCFARQRGMKNWVCDGLVIFEAPSRLLRWPCLSGMVDLTREAVDDTAQVCVACFRFRNMPRRVGQPPQIE